MTIFTNQKPSTFYFLLAIFSIFHVLSAFYIPQQRQHVNYSINRWKCKLVSPHKRQTKWRCYFSIDQKQEEQNLELTLSMTDTENELDEESDVSKEEALAYIENLEGILTELQKRLNGKEMELVMLRDEVKEIGTQYIEERRLRNEEAGKLSKVREELTRQLIAIQNSANEEQNQLKRDLSSEIGARDKHIDDLQYKVFDLEQHISQLEMEKGNLRAVLSLARRLILKKLRGFIVRYWKQLSRRPAK